MDVLSFVSLRVNLSDLQRFSVHEKYKMQIYFMFLKMKTVFIALIRGRVLLDLSDMQYWAEFRATPAIDKSIIMYRKSTYVGVLMLQFI